MPNAFNFSESPFDSLNPDEQGLVRSSVDIAYFRAGETILDVGVQPTHLFVIIKGVVNQYDGTEVSNVYGVDDCFDGRGLVADKVSSRFEAAEEVVAYQLAKKAVSSLIASNATFGAMLFSDLSNKLSAISQRQSQHELQSLSMARVDEAFVRPAHFVDADTDIVSVVKLFQAERTTTVLVRDRTTQPPRLGIFTHTGLQRAILSGTPLHELPVGRLANFVVISVRPSDQLGDALAVMIQKRVHRVVVTEASPDGLVDSEHIVGVLEALDLFSFLSNHSYLISIKIIESTSITELAQAAQHINRLIALLQQSGTKVSLIGMLVQELNARLFERAWQLIAPAELVSNGCLFVMGSEGRGEQLLKTDQDNGLVLRDGYTPPADLAAICDRFSAALAGFGYPECPGRIMLNNPAWRHPLAEFAQTARRWLLLPTPDSLMALAIFIDAHAVCGDASLLVQLRAEVMALVTDNDALLARFAAAINAFDAEGQSSWWLRLRVTEARHDALDLKKAGTFPLVHGVRALALAERLGATGTVERITALVAAHRLPAALGAELTDSLHFFMRLKLEAGLAALAAGQTGSAIVLDRLSSLDRDLLKDTLAVVKRFKLLLRQRFHLDAV